MIDIYYENPILEKNAFFIEPFYKITDLVLEKYVSENFFQKILEILFRYFKTVKKHRTIDDVDRSFKYVSEFLESYTLKSIKQRAFEKESENLRNSLKKFIDINIEQIGKILNDAKSGVIAHVWISSIRISFDILSDTLKSHKRKVRLLERRTRRAIQFLEKKLENLHKALFLVLFRIIEQIYIIANEERFIPEKEITYLIEDVVYLENIARITND